MTVPGTVSEVCERFLASAPAGLVTGLYLRGGVGFGEWFEGQSDVDFVATLARRATPADADALRATHTALLAAYPQPFFSGMHLQVEDLRRDPRLAEPGPTVLEGVFDPSGRLDTTVAWHELARHGHTVAGTPHTELGIWTDQQVLLDLTRANLDTYWRAQGERLAVAVAAGCTTAHGEWICTWCGLGAPRLHHLLVTGEMTTKSRAGRWALETYPDRFHPVLHEALRVREGGAPGDYADQPLRRASDTVALLEYVVAQGTRVGESR